jgi:hypothetical protein
MTNIKNVLCQDFEHEMWLYITEELPSERMEFWKKHLLNCDECLLELNEELTATSAIKEEVSVDLDDSTFNRMIDKAVSKKINWVGNTLRNRFNYAENKSFYGKAALIGAFATTAMIVLLVTHQSIPDPVKNIPKDLLDWEGTKVISQIDDLNNRIQMINEDKWGKEIYLLDQRMEKLEKKSDKFSFN